MRWVHDANCFLSRYQVDPARREEFIGAVNELLAFAGPWYDEGCNFAFQGWSRDPNQWVAIASWKTEDILNKLRQTPEFRDITSRMLACCTGDMTMEEFAGMKNGRWVFDQYPAGRSDIYLPSGTLRVNFV
jgi:quinol monooxygenase YgiN